MMEIGYVGIAGSSEAHIDAVCCLVINNLGHHLESIGQFACEGHLFMVPAILPKDFDQVVI